MSLLTLPETERLRLAQFCWQEVARHLQRVSQQHLTSDPRQPFRRTSRQPIASHQSCWESVLVAILDSLDQ